MLADYRPGLIFVTFVALVGLMVALRPLLQRRTVRLAAAGAAVASPCESPCA
jgi:hypothetical protein